MRPKGPLVGMVVLVLAVLGVSAAWCKPNGPASPPDTTQSYVLLSLIKSVAGVKPKDEFFDIRMRFKRSDISCTLASIDAALSTTDSSSTNRVLSDAEISLNWGFPPAELDTRTTMYGPAFRVFDAQPYAGLHVVGQELPASKYAGTMVTGALLWSIDSDHHYLPALFADFFVAALGKQGKEEFLNKVALRGSYLVPLQRGAAPVSRIVIEVPIGGLTTF